MSRADVISVRIDAGVVHVQAWRSGTLLQCAATISLASKGIDGLLQVLSDLAGSQEWRKDASNSFVAVSVSTHWLGHANLPWSSSWIGDRQEKIAARLHLEAAGFEVVEGDTVAVDNPGWGKPRLVVLWPSALERAIKFLVESWRPRSIQVSSTASLAWRKLGAGVDCIVLAEKHGEYLRLTFVRGQGNHVYDVLTRPVLPGGARQIVRSVLRRAGWIALRDEESSNSVNLPIHVDFDAFARVPRPASLATDLPDIAPRSSFANALLSWAGVCIITLLVLTLAASWSSFRFWDMTEMSRLEDAKRVESRQPAKPFLPSRELEQQILSVNRAIQGLNTPVVDMMRSLVPPKDISVGVLGLELASVGRAAGPQILKVHAESPTPIDMTRYVAFLTHRRPFVSATLVHHEASDGAGGFTQDAAYRYTVELQWQR